MNVITALYSLGEIQGAGFWIGFWAICGVLYLLFSFLPKKNRVKGRAVAIVSSLLIGGTVTDFCWFFWFYPGGEYVNRGLGGGAMLLLWPVILLLFGILISLFPRKKR